MLFCAVGSAQLQAADTVVPGRNVNMVAGPVLIETAPHFRIEGDPFPQRQNEPSCDVSTRNPMHVFCASNDYRTVEIPGDLADGVTGDAWIGLYWSNNGGQTFRSTLLPGFRQDDSPTGAASPLHGFEAGADPVMRAGTNGMFYLSGIAFDREANISASAPAAGAGGSGVVFLTRFIDLNNSPSDQRPVRQVGQPIVLAEGVPGRFLDKPWLVVDKPRPGSGSCTVEVDGTTQTFPSGNIYVAYTAFIDKAILAGSDDDSSEDGISEDDGTANDETKKISRLYVTTLRNCGTVQDEPVRISGPRKVNRINQGASLAVDPQTGDVVVVWRRFRHKDKQSDAILMSRSTDGGANWSAPQVIASVDQMDRLDLSKVSGTFDQGSTKRSMRTNAFPSVVISDSGDPQVPGNVYVVWAQRQAPAPQGHAPRESRIVITASADGGLSWSPAVPLDDDGVTGHQFQPSLAYAHGRLTVAYLDLREDHTEGRYEVVIEDDPGDPGNKVVKLQEYRVPRGDMAASCTECDLQPDPRKVRTDFLVDAAPENPDPEIAPVYSRHLKRRHTLDVRVRQFPAFDPAAGPPAGESAKVTRFEFGRRQDELVQFKYLPPGLNLFANATLAFLGDYIDCAAQKFTLQDDGTWGYNDDPSLDPILFCTWTDNRNVRLGPDNKTDDFTPTGAGCVANLAGTRNQDVFNSRVTRGLFAGSFGNSRPLGFSQHPDQPGESFLLQRAFDLLVDNTTTQTRHYRLTIANQPAGAPLQGRASFLQFPAAPFTSTTAPEYEPPVGEIDVSIGPISSVARSIFVSSEDPGARVRIDIRELDAAGGNVLAGGQRSVVMLNPDPTNPPPPFPDPNLPDTGVPDPKQFEEYDVQVSFALENPINFALSGISAPDPSNPDPTNPDPTNPDPTNLVVEFPDPTNPDPTNPDPTNPDPTNPDPTNPDPTNPDPTNATLWNESVNNAAFAAITDLDNASIRDTHWNVVNDGNVAVTYAVRLLSDSDLPEGIRLQLLIHRTDVTPVPTGPGGCTLKLIEEAVVLVNKPDPALLDSAAEVSNPDPTNPDPTNTTFSIGPGENARLTVRVLDADLSDGVTFTPASEITPVLVAPVNTLDQLDGNSDPGVFVPGGIMIVTRTLPDAVIESPYSAIVESLGGTAPFAWSIVAGQLPAGLSLRPSAGSTVEISGNTTDDQTIHEFTIQVVDADGNSAAHDLRIVPVGMKIETETLPHAPMLSDYSAFVDALGGTAPYSWDIVAGQLPPGLSLRPSIQPSVEIAGTTTIDRGIYEFTVRVMDVAGLSATRDLEIVVCITNPPPGSTVDPDLVCPGP